MIFTGTGPAGIQLKAGCEPVGKNRGRGTGRGLGHRGAGIPGFGFGQEVRDLHTELGQFTPDSPEVVVIPPLGTVPHPRLVRAEKVDYFLHDLEVMDHCGEEPCLAGVAGRGPLVQDRGGDGPDDLPPRTGEHVHVQGHTQPDRGRIPHIQTEPSGFVLVHAISSKKLHDKLMDAAGAIHGPPSAQPPMVGAFQFGMILY